MGEESSQLTVEESTEPPICAQRAGNSNAHVPLPPNVRSVDGSSPRQDVQRAAHTFAASQVTEALDVDPQNGLTNSEAESRLRQYGLNKIKGAQGVPLWEILLSQVSNSLTLVLVMTMGLSFGINDYIEGGVITAVICLNIVVGFFQDYHAAKTINSLMELAAPISKVLRDGRIDSIKAERLVPGDVVQLAVGDIVPADLRLVDGVNAATDEAQLTGESLPVSKMPFEVFMDKNLAPGDRTNMAFSGTTMTAGRATGIVVATGMETEFGSIANMLRSSDGVPKSHRWFKRRLQVLKNGTMYLLGLDSSRTPLGRTLSKFALLLFALAILLAIIVFSANRWKVGGEVLIYGICVAVAVVPESLIAVLTITFAVGTKAMAKGNVITRKLSALESVGGITNICSDKTGTLTQGRMIARKAWVPGAGILTVHDSAYPFDPNSGYLKVDNHQVDLQEYSPNTRMSLFMQAIALCNLSMLYGPTSISPLSTKPRKVIDDAESIKGPELSPETTIGIDDVSNDWAGAGEPTEIALHVLAHRLGMGRSALISRLGIVHAAEFPFDSTGKKMTVVYRNSTSNVREAFTKGASEVIVPLLDVSEAEEANIRATADRMASEGLRVLCVAHRSLHDDVDISNRATVERGLQFLGLVGLYDPPRLETAEAVRRCQLAGITIHMVTGDHPQTAMAIAQEVGILKSGASNVQTGTAVMHAEEFDRLTDVEIDTMGNLPLVLARCSPTTKVKVVQAMRRRRAFCLMTGDGVNDSPALKHADVGVAMGLNGSDVAKEAADMVLTDDNFASIVKAVEEGRRLFDNIQKFLMHLLISNIAQVILLLIGLVFKDQDNHSVFPLSPIEILWVNLITSSFLAIGLGLEESQLDIMYRSPRPLSTGVFTRELITDKFIYGFFMGSLCLAAFASVAYYPGNGDLGSGCNEAWNETCETVFKARATTYATITLLLLVTAWEVKHFFRSLFNLDPTRTNNRTFSVFPTVWRNRFLFWAVAAGFMIMFPVIYLPVINKQVFKHVGITWEWGIVFGCVVVYVSAIESWKAIKRRFGIGSAARASVRREHAEMRGGLEIEVTE